jgi:hypothetical protein
MSNESEDRFEWKMSDEFRRTLIVARQMILTAEYDER